MMAIGRWTKRKTGRGRKSAMALLALGSIAVVSAESPSVRGAEVNFRERGEAIIRESCVQCHAIEKTGRSPHAAAPAFRNLDRGLDLDALVDRLRGGLMAG